MNLILIIFDFQIYRFLMRDIKKIKNKWKAQFELKIDAKVNQIWELISSPSNLESFHPFCKSNKTITWPGKKSVDELIYLNGLTYIREFYTWEKLKGYSLFIGEKNKKKSFVIWEIFSKNESQFLKITVYPYFLRNLPKWISYLPYKLIVIPALEAYLKSVIGGINYHLKNKEITPKNYFGEHKWFS